MSGDPLSGQIDWRGGKRLRRQTVSRNRMATRKYLGLAVLASLLLVAAACLVWIIAKVLFIHPFGPDFVPLFVARYEERQVPPLPQAEADFRAIQQQTL